MSQVLKYVCSKKNKFNHAEKKHKYLANFVFNEQIIEHILCTRCFARHYASRVNQMPYPFYKEVVF